MGLLGKSSEISAIGTGLLSGTSIFLLLIIFYDSRARKSTLNLNKRKFRASKQNFEIKSRFPALQSINNTMNAEIIDLNNELIANEQHIVKLLNEIANLTNLSEKISFYQMLKTNIRYVQQLPLPMKGLIMGGTIYKIYGNKNVKENEQDLVPTETFVLMPNANPDIEALAPKADTTSYQKVVEVSSTPLLKEIQISKHGNWLPF